ncbi:MAG: S8 family serine peptidase [Solirubrobacterales bacterium]
MKIRIAIIDSGINVEYNEFTQVPIEGINLIEYSNKIKDAIGHGTACAGEIVRINDNVVLHIVKIYDNILKTSLSKLIEALEYLESLRGINIINISSSVGLITNYSNLYSERLNNVLDKLYKKNVLVVCAANNKGLSGFPASLDNVLGVRSIVSKTERIEYKCNDEIQCDYYGDYRFMPTVNGRYEFFVGNSAATPRLVAYISKIMLINKTNDIKEIKSKMSGEINSLLTQSNMNDTSLHIKEALPNGEKEIIELLLKNLNKVKRIVPDWLEAPLKVLQRDECFDLIHSMKEALNIDIDYKELTTFDFDDIYTLSLKLRQMKMGGGQNK